jgi:hypothetical protein
MPLTNQHTSMMDRFGETQFEYLSLQSPLQEIFDFKSEYVIQLHAGFVEHTNSDKTTNQGVSFEKTTRVSFCEINLRIWRDGQGTYLRGSRVHEQHDGFWTE